jgi:hypothetical protein
MNYRWAWWHRFQVQWPRFQTITAWTRKFRITANFHMESLLLTLMLIPGPVITPRQ